LHIEKVLELTQSSNNGLSSSEAEKRLLEQGPNSLKEKKKISPIMIFLHQFRDFMILILLAAAVISGIIGDVTDTIIIIAIILLNSIIGFIQEYRAEKALEALKKMASSHALVLRDGQPKDIPAEDLVTGDIVLLEAGNIIPADIRLTETKSLLLNESALTGESLASNKNTVAIDGKDTALGDRLNMAYKTTLVSNGRGTGVVISTGMQTEIGRIANLLQENESETPLKKRMRRKPHTCRWSIRTLPKASTCSRRRSIDSNRSQAKRTCADEPAAQSRSRSESRKSSTAYPDSAVS